MRARRRARRSCASSRRPSGPDFSGWNWAPKTFAARHHARELRAVHGGAEHVLVARRPRREGVHVVEGAWGPASPSVSGDSRRQATGFQPMCGTLRPGASSASTAPSSSPMPVRAAVLGGALEQQLHAHADADDRHARVAALAQQLVEAQLAHRLHRLRASRRRPGSTTPAAPRTASWSRVIAGVDAHVLERLLHRAQVAHAVVEDRARRSQQALRGRDAASRRGRSTPPRAARARTP